MNNKNDVNIQNIPEWWGREITQYFLEQIGKLEERIEALEQHQHISHSGFSEAFTGKPLFPEQKEQGK